MTFEQELAILLNKYKIAIIARDLKDENSLSVEVGFQKDRINNTWTGRHHVGGCDLEGVADET